MKKIILSALLSLITLSISVSAVTAQTNMCNQSCEVDSDCGNSYSCYVGVCRLNACPAVSTCTCTNTATTVTPTPTVLPYRTATPTPTPRPTVTPIATISATLDQTPKTGFNAWTVVGLSFGMFILGSALVGGKNFFELGDLPPNEIVKKRSSSK